MVHCPTGGGGRQWVPFMHGAVGSGQWVSCSILLQCMGAMGSGFPLVHCCTAGGHGQWASFLTLPQGKGQWAVGLLSKYSRHIHASCCHSSPLSSMVQDPPRARGIRQWRTAADVRTLVLEGGGWVGGGTGTPANCFCPPPTALQTVCAHQTLSPNRFSSDCRQLPWEPLLKPPVGPFALKRIAGRATNLNAELGIAQRQMGHGEVAAAQKVQRGAFGPAGLQWPPQNDLVLVHPPDLQRPVIRGVQIAEGHVRVAPG